MEIKKSGNKNIVYLEGEINAQTSIPIKAKVLELFNTGTVILSFRSVVYMNSSGLREVIDLLKTSQKLKKDLLLCDMSHDIKELFSFTGLDKVFKIYDTEQQAIG